MSVSNGTRNWNSRAVNTFLHHDVAIGPLSHQKKSRPNYGGGACLIGHNWSLRKNAVSWLREVLGS